MAAQSSPTQLLAAPVQLALGCCSPPSREATLPLSSPPDGRHRGREAARKSPILRVSTSRPNFHDYHHEKFKVNYGNVGILDMLHGTDKMYQDHLAALQAKAKEKPQVKALEKPKDA